MSVFKLQDNLPEIYTEDSRDFQLLCRLYDCVNNGVMGDINSMSSVTFTKECKSEVLQLLSDKLGFAENIKVSDEVLRYILMAFPDIVKNKGSREGIKKVLNIFAKINHLKSDMEYDIGDVSYLKTEKRKVTLTTNNVATATLNVYLNFNDVDKSFIEQFTSEYVEADIYANGKEYLTEKKPENPTPTINNNSCTFEFNGIPFFLNYGATVIFRCKGKAGVEIQSFAVTKEITNKNDTMSVNYDKAFKVVKFSEKVVNGFKWLNNLEGDYSNPKIRVQYGRINDSTYARRTKRFYVDFPSNVNLDDEKTCKVLLSCDCTDAIANIVVSKKCRLYDASTGQPIGNEKEFEFGSETSEEIDATKEPGLYTIALRFFGAEVTMGPYQTLTASWNDYYCQDAANLKNDLGEVKGIQRTDVILWDSGIDGFVAEESTKGVTVHQKSKYILLDYESKTSLSSYYVYLGIYLEDGKYNVKYADTHSETITPHDAKYSDKAYITINYRYPYNVYAISLSTTKQTQYMYMYDSIFMRGVNDDDNDNGLSNDWESVFMDKNGDKDYWEIDCTYKGKNDTIKNHFVKVKKLGTAFRGLSDVKSEVKDGGGIIYITDDPNNKNFRYDAYTYYEYDKVGGKWNSKTSNSLLIGKYVSTDSAGYVGNSSRYPYRICSLGSGNLVRYNNGNIAYTGDYYPTATGYKFSALNYFTNKLISFMCIMAMRNIKYVSIVNNKKTEGTWSNERFLGIEKIFGDSSYGINVGSSQSEKGASKIYFYYRTSNELNGSENMLVSSLADSVGNYWKVISFINSNDDGSCQYLCGNTDKGKSPYDIAFGSYDDYVYSKASWYPLLLRYLGSYGYERLIAFPTSNGGD